MGASADRQAEGARDDCGVRSSEPGQGAGVILVLLGRPEERQVLESVERVCEGEGVGS